MIIIIDVIKLNRYTTPVLYIQGWDFSHSEATTKIRLHTSMLLRCGIYPTQSPSSTAGNPLLEFRVRGSVNGISPTQKHMRSRLRSRNFSLSEAQLRSWDFSRLKDKTYRNHRWDYPTTWEHNKHTKSFTRQVKYSGVKDMHFKETQSISNKTDGKINQTRFIQALSFHIQIFIPNLFIPVILLD